MFPGFDNNNGSEDYLDEFRQKLNSPSMENFEERKNEINRSKNVFIGTVSGIALAAVVGWFVLSPRYSNDPNVELPVIRRPQTAIKVQPTEPGGMEILNQDKSVYDIIEKKDNSAPVVENLLPPPEEPQMPTIAQEVEPISPPPPAQQALNSSDQVGQQAAEIIKVAEAPQPKAVQNPTDEDKLVPISQAINVEAVAQAPQIDNPQKVEAPKEAPTIVMASQEEVKTPASAQTGSWQIQLLSSPNKAAMETTWGSLTKKYTVLKGQPHEVETADLGSKGTYYRLKAGAFTNRDGADKLCNDIKALGGSCIVKKK